MTGQAPGCPVLHVPAHDAVPDFGPMEKVHILVGLDGGPALQDRPHARCGRVISRHGASLTAGPRRPPANAVAPPVPLVFRSAPRATMWVDG